MSPWPTMFRILQECSSPEVGDIETQVRLKLSSHLERMNLASGARVAIAVGSRGIADIVPIVKTLVEVLRETGAVPFVVPAMGSQGGSTAQGQAAVLEHLGITESRIGASVQSKDDVVCVGQTNGGVPVYCDKLAVSADALVCVNRIKPHTAFRADIESGLMKMLAVGLGKRWSAEAVHSAPGGLARSIVEAARVAIAETPLQLGIAVVEDAIHRTARIAVLAPDEFEDAEPNLLCEARQMMPKLPLEEIDVLIVDEVGKDISGAGMDPNVIGMGRRLGEMRDEPPRIQRIVALSLTEASKGNAEGIGLADITTQRLVDSIDFRATYINCITSGFIRGAMIPLTCGTDEEAIRTALHGFSPQTARVVRVRSTRDLHELEVSEAALEDALRDGGIRQIGRGRPLEFTFDGRLIWQDVAY